MEEHSDVQSVMMKLQSTLPICRVCLDISMDYIEFEGPLCVVNGQEITYSDGFNEIYSPVCELPEILPTNFCVTCGNDLLNAYLFLKRVENANFILNKVKCFTEESVKCDQEKMRPLDVEPNEYREKLKVEIFPELLENEFNKFIDHEDELKCLPIPEEYIKIERQEVLPRTCQMIDSNQFITKYDSQKDDLESMLDSPTTPIFIDTETESEDKNAAVNNSISDESSVWMCDNCGQICETKEVLTEHRKKHEPMENSTCIQCERIFSTSEKLDDHLLFHEYSKSVLGNSDNMVHRCTLCEKDCWTEAEFVDHINIHRGTKPHMCNICSNTFPTKHSLWLHNWRVHLSHASKRSGKEIEKCQRCQKVVRKSHMEKHLEAHSTINKFSCSVCGKQFSTKFGLKAHSVAHKQREFNCHICDKICLTEFTLKKHIQYIHLSDRKKYQCEDCGMVFQYPSYLKDHQRKHNIKNRFQCPHCERSYCRKPQLDIHMRYHNNDFRYKCDQCDKCYVTKSNLTDHIRSRHSKITYDCDKCHQKFKSVTGLRKHKYTHTGYPYICPLCTVGQTSRSGMKAHLFGVHRDAVTEEEFNEMFPIIIPKSGYRRPKYNLETLILVIIIERIITKM